MKAHLIITIDQRERFTPLVVVGALDDDDARAIAKAHWIATKKYKRKDFVDDRADMEVHAIDVIPKPTLKPGAIQ